MTKHRIGVISDTHGLIRSEALQALEGVESIIHAGDVGTLQVLEALQSVAPVIAIEGNIDVGRWAIPLPKTEVVELDRTRLYVLHNLSELDLDPQTAGFHAVIFGHSHRAQVETRRGVLYLNPGSAGPKRFRLPASVALLDVEDGQLKAQIITLPV